VTRLHVPCPEGIGVVENRVTIILFLRDVNDLEDVAAFEGFEEPLGFVCRGDHAKADDDEGDEGEFAAEDAGGEFHRVGVV